MLTLLACEPSGSTSTPEADVRLNAPDDADAEYPPTCSELGPASCSSPCQRGEAAACLHLAEGYLDGAGVPRDPPRALGLMRKSCELGLGRGCGYLAMAIASSDRPASATYAKQGCERGYGGACVWYVGHHVLAVPEPSWEQAAPWVQRGCEAGHARACLVWGDVLRAGQGVAKDPAAASAAYRTACDGGESAGCKMLELPAETPQAHYLATPDPPVEELARANVVGELAPKVSFCIRPDGATEVTSVEGASGKVAAIAKATVERWRFAPPGGTSRGPCTEVVFRLD